jgi:acyl-CoA thioester hydrolase
MSAGMTEDMAAVDMAAVHRFPIRVYYEDTDAAGIVYYANYLKFAERARTEMMRDSGSDHQALARDFDAVFAVSRCEIEYLKPALLDDLLTVETRVLDVGAAVIRLDQQVRRGEDLLARLRLRIACLSRQGRPVRLPDAMRAALTTVRIPKELV